jgi:L-fuconolactonase
LSGLITELAPGGGRQHLEHAIADLLDLFGPRRLLWGSDWPVLAPAGDYGDWLALVKHAIAAQAPDAVDAILGGNALRIYRPSISRAGEAR